MLNRNNLEEFFYQQLIDWQLAKVNFEMLSKVETRIVQVDDLEVYLQFNPNRIVSSSAKIDTKSLAERPCFLCQKNLPPEQRGVVLNKNFTLLVNPFPILRKHFTIVNNAHIPQRIERYFCELLEMTRQLESEYTFFYNGPKCGASAPDHLHFQAGSTEQFPVWDWLERMTLRELFTDDGCSIYSFESHVNGLLVRGKGGDAVIKALEGVMKAFATLQRDEEPMINLLSTFNDEWRVIIFPRQKHRPYQYFEEGDKQLLLSPASVDFGGLLAVARAEDFERIDGQLLKDIFSQLRLNGALFKQLEQKISQL